MKALVFGRTGQVAQELQKLIPSSQFLARDQADLTDPDTCAAAIAISDAEVVINAAAWTAVDRAESEAGDAHIVNASSPKAMALAAAQRKLPFLHISTDYVFAGTGDRPWRPDDPTRPLSAYGRSKLGGEEGVRAAGGQHVILRTSWVFSAHGTNFVRTMLRLSDDRDRLTVVGDQIGGPTAAADIASALVTIARAMIADTGKGGTYHFSSAPDVSWADFAREIFRQAGRNVAVEDIPASAWPTPAPRPANSRLDCDSLVRDFGLQRPDWRQALGSVLRELQS